MARSTFGSLQEFQPDSESITAYLERTSVYFTANSIEAAKQVPVLLSVIGAKPIHSCAASLQRINRRTNRTQSCPKFYRRTLNPSHCSLLSDSTFTDAIKPMESLLLNLLLSYDDCRHTVNLETNSMTH